MDIGTELHALVAAPRRNLRKDFLLGVCHHFQKAGAGGGDKFAQAGFDLRRILGFTAELKTALPGNAGEVDVARRFRGAIV